MENMKAKKYKYIFGPVPSRRLGHSLGIDVVPYKVCSFDCIYCELGRTTIKTIDRNEYCPLKDIIEELSLKLKDKIKIDYITIAGSGEPTLYSKIKNLINGIKEITNIPVAVLTNGSLLWQKKVQKDLKDADLVIPSLDAGCRYTYKKVNRPCNGLSFEKIVCGLIEFAGSFENKIWLEIFLLKNITANDEEVKKIAEITKYVWLEKIQLNTVSRPPAESFAQAVPKEEMNYYKNFFLSNTEVINSNFKHIINDKEFKANEIDIINLLKRRPCTIEDISFGLQMHKSEVLKYIENLLREKKVRINIEGNKTFYCIN